MPIYVYNKADRYYISPLKLNTRQYKLLCVYKELRLVNVFYYNMPKDCDYHILNSNLVPTRKAYIIIFNKTTLKLRLFEPFDVLKDYAILDDEYSSVMYYINNGIKVHYGKFDIRNFYNVCSGCKRIHNCKIQKCIQCSNCMCSRCNVLESTLCDDCGIIISDSSDIEVDD